MKHPIKVDVVTWKKGLFGNRKVKQRKTLVLSGKEPLPRRQGRWNDPVFSEEQRLAALCRMWDEDREHTT